MKLVNQALNKIRIQAQVKFKGSRFLLLKNSADLTETEIEQLEQILAQSPRLLIAYLMKEECSLIYETSSTGFSSMNRFKKWLTGAQVIYGIARTMREHKTGICNYFISRTRARCHGRH